MSPTRGLRERGAEGGSWSGPGSGGVRSDRACVGLSRPRAGVWPPGSHGDEFVYSAAMSSPLRARCCSAVRVRSVARVISISLGGGGGNRYFERRLKFILWR